MSCYWLTSKKNDAILVKLNKALEHDCSMHRSTSEAMAQSFIQNKLKHEMTDARLPSFVAFTDRLVYNAWVHHYSHFNANLPLLTDEMLVALHHKLESMFPMHYGSIHSLLFGR